MKPEIVDLCSGCGGFSLGAELAGFKTVVAVDIDPDLRSSFTKNFPESKIVSDGIESLNRKAWNKLYGTNRPVGVIGGPPCQGFSRIGKRNPSDPRNNLIGQFYRQVAILKPAFFVMENVEGLMDADNAPILYEALAQLPSRYEVLQPIMVNAADYGAPTLRKRVIVVGYDPNEIDTMCPEDFVPQDRGPRVTVADAISDLPSPMGESITQHGFGWTQCPSRVGRPTNYVRECKTLPPKGVGWKTAIENLKKGIITGLMPTKHTPEVKKRFGVLTPGEVDPISRYPRLSWLGQCPTLRAGTGKDRGSHQAARPIHPEEPRVVTVREAARLQGFPDWFVFHPTIWHSFRMIGNSVSPHVSQSVLQTIRSKLF